MVDIYVTRDTRVRPERKFLTIHEIGSTYADVTEGSAWAGGIWERARYDWSVPGLVTLTVTDSQARALTARPGAPAAAGRPGRPARP